MTERVDLVVIGGGYAGYPSAIRASQLGMKVALVEKSKLEGNCLHRGCIPTKALLQSASMLSGLERHGEELGVLTEGVSFDYSRAAKYRDEVVGKLREGTRYLMRKNGIATYEGTGRFLEPKKIEVRLKEGGKQTLEARYILIASGSAPRSLPGLETDHEQVLTSDDVLTMNSLPSSLVILGSGAVGVEFASMYRDFGVEVTVVEILDRIVPGEDAEVSAMLKKSFAERGVRLLTNAKADPMSLRKTDRGVTIGVFTEGGAEILTAEALLMAVGRRTITESLNLEATGVETNARGEILVDECYRTAEPGVYAVGDVIGGHQLAHVANHKGLIAAEHMSDKEPAFLDPNLVPRGPRRRQRDGATLLPGDYDRAQRWLVQEFGLRGEGGGGALRPRRAAELDYDPASGPRPGRARPGVQRIRQGSERRNEVSRESRMTASILLPTVLSLSVLSPDVVSLKARRRSLPSKPAESRGVSTAFPAVGANGLVRVLSCSDTTPDVGVLREKN